MLVKLFLLNYPRYVDPFYPYEKRLSETLLSLRLRITPNADSRVLNPYRVLPQRHIFESLIDYLLHLHMSRN
jgi:hypothetical protein